IFSAALCDIDPFIRKRAAHAAKHASIDQVPDRSLHYAPRRGSRKEYRLLCSEQRLELWMDLAVKILKILAAMSHQWTRKCRPCFFGYFNRTGNEKFVVRLHRRTSNACHE